MHKFTLVLASLLFTMAGFAQTGTIYQNIQTEHDAQTTFTNIQPFHQQIIHAGTDSRTKDVVTQGALIQLNEDALQAARQAEHYAITVEIPTLEYGVVELDLVKVDILADGFQVVTSDGRQLDGDLGVHYHGIIKGMENSIAAISFYEHNEIAGFFANNEGNFVIGRMEKSVTNHHIVYNDKHLIPEYNSTCATSDEATVGYRQGQLRYDNANRAPGDCLRIFIEVDDDIYSNKGANTQSFVTAFFNQSAVLYANENITIGISQIYVWTTASPFTGTNSGTLLGQFQAQYSNANPFDGDIGHMISYSGGGGIAAGFSAICNSEIDNRMCFSGINSSYANVPTFSWTVQVFTHEMGHLFGCRHTHACVWNGNNTAIDGCSGVEGNCSQPGIPSNGGTIMSYCHLQNVGINFNNGFGLQPGNVMRNNVDNAICLASSCTGNYPTCDDGVQNQDETGVDCGGVNCPACPCSDNQIEISILSDSYPEETSWQFVDANGNVVVEAGPFNYVPTNTTFSQVVCLPNGCYDFIINDSYGDGLFDGNNTGTYTVTELTNNNTVLASGSGNFGSSQTTNFCVNGGTPPTCTDGIQNGDETGVDCGGSNCPVCPPSCTDGIQNQDETGVDCGGSNCPACPPTCTDGIQNGDEEGVDCGGSNCAPCPCNGTDITLSILFDSWPDEISWSLADDAGNVVDSDSYSNNNLANSTDTRTYCLADDCYVFTINDSYGDGLFDSQNTGNVTIETGNGETLVFVVGNFGSQSVSNFCVPIPTCTDGVQNGDETGVDCGGSNCPDCPTGIYVDASADGADNGTSWENAYRDLQDALAVGANQTIHIAEGVYIPTNNTTARGTAFDIPTGATLLGGYPMGGGTRDPIANGTFLSGNIDGDNSYDGNSYHVVRLLNVTDVVIDGVHIKDGSADNENSFGRSRGGGVYSNGASATFNDVVFRRNNAIKGGAVFATLSPNITFNNCEIKLNVAENGSALYHSNQTNMFINSCWIVNNNSTTRCAIEINNSLSTEINNTVIANNASRNANAIGFIATNRDQTCNIYNSTILGETKDKYLLSLQTGNNDVLDLNIYNSIIAHQNTNFTKNAVAYNNGTLNFLTQNCYIQGSSIIGTNDANIYEDVVGDLMLNADYSLNECSPAVNAGDNSYMNGLTSDFAGNDRIFDTTVDMGAYESQTTCGTNFREMEEEVQTYYKVKVYPNPTNGILNIKTDLEIVNVEVFDILGQQILSSQQRELDIRHLNDGIYILNVRNENGELIRTEKIMKR